MLKSLKGYVRVGKADELSPGSTIVVSGKGIDRVDVCLAKVGEEYYAISNICTHKGGPMNEGTLREKHIVCPWHKAYFRLDTGSNSFPAERALRVFPVKAKDGLLYVKVSEESDGKPRSTSGP